MKIHFQLLTASQGYHGLDILSLLSYSPLPNWCNNEIGDTRPLLAYSAKLSHQRGRGSSFKYLFPNYVLQAASIQEGTPVNTLGPSGNRNTLTFVEAMSLHSFIF